jgi:c-di-GMP-binding flagellar brake protein YcgR
MLYCIQVFRELIEIEQLRLRDSGGAEENSNAVMVLQVDEMEPSALRELVRFIYTRTVRESFSFFT